jgi:3-methyladenine DNA glycosylase AlkD
MKFFRVDESVDEKVDELLKIIRLRMNGDVSSLMEQRGIHYRMNYGVSLGHLREMATPYMGNNQLASRLWFLEIRETMLLASIIVQPSDLEVKTCLEWSRLITTPELVEHASLQLFSKVPDVQLLVHQLFKEEHEYAVATALFTAAWATRNGTYHEIVEPQWLEKELWSLRVPTALEQRGLAVFVRQQLRMRGLNEGAKWMKWIQTQTLLNLKWLEEEVRSEIEFLEGR